MTQLPEGACLAHQFEADSARNEATTHPINTCRVRTLMDTTSEPLMLSVQPAGRKQMQEIIHFH